MKKIIINILSIILILFLLINICPTKTQAANLDGIMSGADDFINKGTNGTVTEDVICNVYDMASNCREWTTETGYNSEVCCIWHGSSFHENDINRCASTRNDNEVTISREYIAFRPIIYL